MTTRVKIDPLKLKEIEGKLALAKSNLKMANFLLTKGEFFVPPAHPTWKVD